MTTTDESKSQNPAFPDAPPTAPGGMSEAALVVELVEKHGFEIRNAKALTWPQKINVVIENRLAREREAKLQALTDLAAEQAEVGADIGQEDEHGYREPDADMFDDLDDMLAEFGLAEEQPEPATEAAVELIETLAPHIEDIAQHMVEDLLDADHEMGAVVDEDGVIDPETMFADMARARQAEESTQPAPLFLGIPGIKDYIFDGHAGAGPSGAERWMNCTMSLSAARKFLETLSPNQQAAYAQSGTAARQGTTAHAAAEVEANMLLGRVTEEEVEHTLNELTFFPAEEDEAYDEEMAEYITEYTDLVKSYAQDRGNDHVLIESRVEAAIPLTDLHEGEIYVIRGSADLAVLPVKSADARALVVGDLKYGNGLDVDVNENPQIRLYALGVLELLVDDEGNLPDWLDTVVYHIVQPRLGGIKTWSESIDDLLTWRDEVLAPALTKALFGEDEGATFEPSDLACQWCPARGSCPALTTQRVEAAAGLFDAVIEAEYENGPGSFPETTSLTDTRLGELLAQVMGLVDLKDDLKAEAQRRLHRGGSVPGFQLVSYTPRRQWTSDAAEALAEVAEVWKDPEMMTPTQAVKALGEMAKSIEEYIDSPPKRPVIAKVGDRRKTWEGTPPEQMFPDNTTGDQA